MWLVFCFNFFGFFFNENQLQDFVSKNGNSKTQWKWLRKNKIDEIMDQKNEIFHSKKLYEKWGESTKWFKIFFFIKITTKNFFLLYIQKTKISWKKKL